MVLVLAAGRGERFAASGGAVQKLQALLVGKPVLQHTLDAVVASGLPHHVVQADPSQPGMGDSIAAGVRATPAAAGWLILPGDLPLIQAATLRQIAAALPGQRAVVPQYQGRPGHPVAFSAEMGFKLINLKGNQGAASVLLACNAMQLIVTDIGCVTDIDTLQDLQAAELLYRERLGAA
ncbi:MAG: NTP transferase domain-containing protein [Burkholderiaceae bacterium]